MRSSTKLTTAPLIAGLFVGLFAGLVTACELERGTTAWEPQTSLDAAHLGDTVDAGDETTLGIGPGAGTMTGTWLLIHESSNCVLSQEQVTLASYIVEIDQQNRVLHETRQLCETHLSPVLGLRPLIPHAVLETLSFIDVDEGFVSSLRTRGAYTSSTEVVLWGISLDDPMRDPLPADPEDPRVLDPDADGHPGVTFHIEGSDCRRYVGQRQLVRYNGFFTAPNQIDGSSITVTDTIVYGSTNPLCGVAPALEPNDAHSKFRMVRVDGLGGSHDGDANADGAITCAEIRPLIDQAWEGREPDNQNCRN